MNTRDELRHKAIACYEKAGMVYDMCRCLKALGEYDQAAVLYEQNNEPWQVAWMYAQEAHLFYRARYLVQKTPVLDLADELSRDLILARCEAEIGSKYKCRVGKFVSTPRVETNLPTIKSQNNEKNDDSQRKLTTQSHSLL